MRCPLDRPSNYICLRTSGPVSSWHLRFLGLCVVKDNNLQWSRDHLPANEQGKAPGDRVPYARDTQSEGVKRQPEPPRPWKEHSNK
jgi:hypothetical protein